MSKGSLSSSEKTKYDDKYMPAYATACQIGPEDDDMLHDPKMGRRLDDTGTIFTLRGCLNIGTLAFLACSLLMLFAGYPILTAFFTHNEGLKGGFGLGGSNATGQIPMLQGMPTLIDKDTPVEAYERMSIDGTRKMKLVFSDEFNQDGRSFVSHTLLLSLDLNHLQSVFPCSTPAMTRSGKQSIYIIGVRATTNGTTRLL